MSSKQNHTKQLNLFFDPGVVPNKPSTQVAVSGDVVCNKPKVLRKCIRTKAHTWLGQLPNSLELASIRCVAQWYDQVGNGLSGNIEVDETLIGGEEKGGKHGRSAGRKSIVVIAVESR